MNVTVNKICFRRSALKRRPVAFGPGPCGYHRDGREISEIADIIATTLTSDSREDVIEGYGLGLAALPAAPHPQRSAGRGPCSARHGDPDIWLKVSPESERSLPAH